MRSQLARTSKGPIEYVMRGDGPVLLACHGTSSDCFATDLVAPLVAAGFSVLSPSRPGYGRTPLEVGRSAAEAAEALVALLDSQQVPKCSVVAISGGGPTGITLAARFPQRVERLILVAAQSRPEERPHEPGYKDQSAFYGADAQRHVESAGDDEQSVASQPGPANPGDFLDPRTRRWPETTLN